VFSLSAHAADEKSWGSLLARGDAAFGAKHMDEALHLFDQSLQAAEMPEQMAMSTTSMATAYLMSGDYSHAEVLFGVSIGYWQNAQERPAHFIAATYNNFGDLLTEMHQFAKAREMYAKALAVWKEAKDDEHPRLAFAMSKLAASHNLNGDGTKAETLLKEAIALHRNSGGPETLDLATSLDSLGKLYTYQRRYELAEPLFQESLAVTKRVMGERDVAYAISLENLATMHRLAGNGVRSEPLLRKVISIFEESLGPRHPYLAMAWSERGLIALEDRNPGMAISYLQRAYDLSVDAYGPNHLRTYFAKGNLALAYIHSGKLDTAQKICEEVLPLQRGSADITPDEFVRTLANCAELSLKLREAQKAEGYFREAISIWRGLSDRGGPSFGHALLGYARALKASHNPEARQIEQEAKSFLENNRR